jgi:hypothetical protein
MKIISTQDCNCGEKSLWHHGEMTTAYQAESEQDAIDNFLDMRSSGYMYYSIHYKNQHVLNIIED